MPLNHKKDFYNYLTEQMSEKFGYADELQAEDGLYTLMEQGVLCDSTGKRISGKEGKTKEEQIDALGGRLKSGETLYIYKKGERFPHEVTFNPVTKAVEISENPVDVNKKPPKPAEHRPRWYRRMFNRYLDIIARMFGGRNETCRKWDAYDDAVKARKNLASSRRLRRREINDEILSKKKEYSNPTVHSKEEAYGAFVSKLKNELGYADDLKKGEKGIENIVLNKYGMRIPMPENPTREELVKEIGGRLHQQEPVYVFKKGEMVPREVYINRDGKLVITEPIDKLPKKDDVKTPGRFNRFFDRFGRRNETAYAYARAQGRENVLQRVGPGTAFYKSRYHKIQEENKKKEAERKQEEQKKASQEKKQEEPQKGKVEEKEEKKEEKKMTLQEEKESLLERVKQIDQLLDKQKGFEPVQQTSFSLGKQEPTEVKEDPAQAQKEPEQKKDPGLQELLDVLKGKNGGNEVSQEMQDVVTNLYNKAQQSMQTLTDKCKDDASATKLISCGEDVQNLVTYQYVKNNIMNSNVPLDDLKDLEHPSVLDVLKMATNLSADTVYFSKYPHNAQTIMKNVLSPEGLNHLTQKFEQSMQEFLGSAFTDQQAYDKALQKADLKYMKESLQNGKSELQKGKNGPQKDAESLLTGKSKMSEKAFGEKKPNVSSKAKGKNSPQKDAESLLTGKKSKMSSTLETETFGGKKPSAAPKAKEAPTAPVSIGAL